MVKPKCSIYFPYIFSKFASIFPQLFQMSQLNCFHHHRSTDVCKNTGIGKTFYSKECFLCKNSSTGCTTSASTAPVPVVSKSHMTSRVCVWPQYYKLFPYFSFGNIPLHFKQGAIPLVTGGWPTKRPVARAVNVPADSSWVLAGMSKK